MTVSEQIISVINVLCEKFGIMVDWTDKNVIPYIELLCGKLVNYEITTSIVWIVFWVLVSVGCIIATKRLYPRFKEGLEHDRDYCECGWQFGTAFAIIGLVVVYTAAAVVTMTQVIDIVQCATFPEMYIFEYVKSLNLGA